MLVDSGNREYARIHAERHELLYVVGSVPTKLGFSTNFNYRDKIRNLEIRIDFLEEHQEKREKHFT